MSEPIKLTEQEVSVLQEIQQTFAEFNQKYGKLSLAKRLVEKEIRELEGEYDTLVDREEEVVKELLTKYGQGTVNTETKEFVPDVTE